MSIELKPVESSQIQAAGYDSATQTMAVRFKGSNFVYHYKGVEPDVAKAFDEAESKGRFFGSTIQGAYDFEKIDVEDE